MLCLAMVIGFSCSMGAMRSTGGLEIVCLFVYWDPARQFTASTQVLWRPFAATASQSLRQETVAGPVEVALRGGRGPVTARRDSPIAPSTAARNLCRTRFTLCTPPQYMHRRPGDDEVSTNA